MTTAEKKLSPEWTYEVVADHPEVKKESDKLNEIRTNVTELEKRKLPDARSNFEIVKRKNLSDESVTWEEVEEARQTMNRVQFQLDKQKEAYAEQQRKRSEAIEEAERVIRQEAKENYERLLKKAINGFEQLKEAHDEAEQMRKYQSRTLGKQVKPPVRIPNPLTNSAGVNDLWYKALLRYFEDKE